MRASSRLAHTPECPSLSPTIMSSDYELSDNDEYYDDEEEMMDYDDDGNDMYNYF